MAHSTSSPFHAYDIRGRLGQEFTRETFGEYAAFIAKLFGGERGLCIGRDVRATSEELYASCIEQIRRAVDIPIYNIGVCTTPQLYFSHWHLGVDVSIMITASHNPPEYNGLKVTGCGGDPIGYANGLKEVEERILRGEKLPVLRTAREVIDKDTREAYLAFLRNSQGERTGLRFAVDAMQGVVGKLVRDILPDAVEYLHCEADGRFLPEGPNPTIAASREALERVVKEQKCDVGVIFDGDGDRVMFVDETGELVPPDLIIALLGDYFYGLRGRDKSQPVLVDIRTSKSTTEYLQRMGVPVEVGRVGRVFMSRKLRAIRGSFGGELAGHYYFGDFNDFDSGLLTALLVLGSLQRMKREGYSLHDWVLKTAVYHNSGELNFKVADDRKPALIEAVRAHFVAQATPTFESAEDGYRVEFPDWWFSIRSSNTEPLLRLIVEARDEQVLQEKLQEARGIIEG